MDPEQKQLLTLSVLPARLDADQAAGFLGFQPHDIPILTAAGLLRPLGHPAPNSTKYFATFELERLRNDVKWLAKSTDAVQAYWRRKNRTLVPTVAQGQRLRSSKQPAPQAIPNLAPGTILEQ